MKILFRTTLILFSILLVSHCNHNEEVTLESPGYEVSNIDPTEDEELMSLLSSTIYGESSTGRIMNSSIGNINLEEAVKVEDFRDGVTRYTFLLESDVSYQFTNLVIRQSSEGFVSSYQLIYRPSIEWLIDNDFEFIG